VVKLVDQSWINQLKGDANCLSFALVSLYDWYDNVILNLYSYTAWPYYADVP